MRKIIVTRDPAKINLAVLKLVEQLGDLTSLSALASDAEYARSQAVAAAAAAQAEQAAAATAKSGAEAAQASAASSSGTAGAHASAAAASATTALLARDAAAISKSGSEAAQAASEGARDASVIAKDQSQAAKVASEAARDTVQSSIYIGPIAPTVTRSGMVWVDRTADDLKIRNASNTAWVLLSDFIGALEYDRAQLLTDPQKAQAQANLGLGAAATYNVIPISRGGTGATDQGGARNALGVNRLAQDTYETRVLSNDPNRYLYMRGDNGSWGAINGMPLSVGQGGTGANESGWARNNLGAAAKPSVLGFTTLSTGGGGQNLPAGGSWAVFFLGVYAGRIDAHGAGLYPGGAWIYPGTDQRSLAGFAWRYE